MYGSNIEYWKHRRFYQCKRAILSIHSRFATDTKQDFFLHYMLQKVLRINLVNMLHETTDEQAFDFLLLLFPAS